MASVLDRDRHQWEGSAYILPCDSEESRRLTFQHEFIVQTLNGSLLLLPTAVIADLSQASIQILDVGTGNGVWLHTFYTTVSRLPCLTGIDIAAEMFPTTYPDTITFETGSVLALSPNWSGRFDLVHQRLLIAGLTVQQWPEALRENLRVTKNGGWLHLVEVNLQNLAVGPASARLLALASQMLEASGMDIALPNWLPGVVRKAGWSDVQVYDREWQMDGDGEKESVARKNTFLGIQVAKGPLVRLSLIHEDEFDETLFRAEREWKTTRGGPHTIRVIVARKLKA